MLRFAGGRLIVYYNKKPEKLSVYYKFIGRSLSLNPACRGKTFITEHQQKAMMVDGLKIEVIPITAFLVGFG